MNDTLYKYILTGNMYGVSPDLRPVGFIGFRNTPHHVWDVSGNSLPLLLGFYNLALLLAGGTPFHTFRMSLFVTNQVSGIVASMMLW